MIRSKRQTREESRWLKVLSTLNEYQARLYVAYRALDQGRGGISRLSKLTGMEALRIRRHKTHPDWNYTIEPRS